MKQEWKRTTIINELIDLTFYYKGTVDLAQMNIEQNEKQQLTLLAKYKIKTIIKFKIKLFLQRVINWIMNVSDYRVKPSDIKQELKSAKRYFKD